MDIEALRSGDRGALARAITLLESSRAEDRPAAERLLRRAMPHTGRAIRIAISGAPGVGKSTFIEALGSRATDQGSRVAVLTIDPTSPCSGGSILGDKTRMTTLAANPRAFVRPSPSGRVLGGVARRTREAMLACEAAGFDHIIVETVGVGQSETQAAAMTDIFLLLLSPAAGDELQGLKRGIMESADIVVVNKCDGSLAAAAAAVAAEARRGLSLHKRRLAAWPVPVVLASSTEGSGIDEALGKIAEYRRLLESNGALGELRRRQARAWLWEETCAQLLAALGEDGAVDQALGEMARQVDEGELPASIAARELVAKFLGSAT